MKPINKQKLLCAFLALGVLSAAACVLNACKEKEPSPIKLVYDKEQQKLTDEENGIVYLFASISYEPMEYRTAPYAMWGEALTFYEVVGWDAKKLLTEEFSGIGGMIYAEDSPLPTLDQMEATEIHICQKNTQTVCLYEIEDKETVARAVDYMVNGEETLYPPEITETYQMKFISDTYAGIYYNTIFLRCGAEGESGSYYLYDRGTKRCVAIPYDLFGRFIYGETSDTTSGADTAADTSVVTEIISNTQ